MAFYKLAALAALSSMVDAKMSEAGYFYNTERPLVVAHRGALGHFPEESMASFVDAYYGGADFIEMDLQVTSDGHLICQHDPDLNETTNIAEYANRFEDRMRDDGSFYVSDFSLSEIKLLKRLSRADDRSPVLNDKFEVLTLQEIIEEVIMLEKDYPRVLNDSPYKVGLYIELKDYTNNLNYLGIDMAEKMNSILAEYGLSTVSDCTDKMPIIVQSFETAALDKYATLSDLPLIMLYNYSHSGEPDWEMFGEKYHGVGPASDWVFNPTSYETGPVDWDKSIVTNTYSNFIA
jgi:glycerophosphoryl diester phosphodiesterase